MDVVGKNQSNEKFDRRIKMNKVTISARTREASKLLKEAIEQNFGFELKGLQHPVEFATDLDADVVIQILKSFIRNERMDSLSFHYEGDTEKEEKQPEILEVPTEVQEEEDDEEEEVWFKDRKPKKRIGSLTLKEEILVLFIGKRQLTSKEIQERLSISVQSVSHLMSVLIKEGKVRRLQRGQWELIIKEPEKEEKKCFKEAVKEAILRSFTDVVQEMSVLLLTDMTGYSPRAIEKALQELKEEGQVIQTKEKGWRLKGFSYPYSNIYEKEEYHPVLDEIMTAEYCKGERLKKMFSEELVNQLLQELVESDCIKKVEEDKYLVYLESRMIYFISKHPGANLGMLKTNMPLEKERDIAANINVLLSNNVVERRGKNRGYVLLSK